LVNHVGVTYEKIGCCLSFLF